jgi:hypothetical protein
VNANHDGPFIKLANVGPRMQFSNFRQHRTLSRAAGPIPLRKKHWYLHIEHADCHASAQGFARPKGPAVPFISQIR